MTMINPVTQKVYVHFGDVPVGGRLLCGKLCSEQMMMMTTRLSQVTCPECIIEDRPPIELNGQMQVLKGWKRINAARELGLKHIPCVVHLPTGGRSLDGAYVLGEEQSLDRIRFAAISNNTVEYQYLEVQAKRFCDICDGFLKGDESMGIGPHEERECEEMLDSIMSEFVANTVTFFGSDLPDSFLEASLTRVLSNNKLGPGVDRKDTKGRSRGHSGAQMCPSGSV